MATAKSRGKSKATKKLQAKTTTKPRVSKAKKTIENKPVSTQPDLVPISPEFEEKLTRHYYEMEKYLRGGHVWYANFHFVSVISSPQIKRRDTYDP
jgi:hypothetical protein